MSELSSDLRQPSFLTPNFQQLTSGSKLFYPVYDSRLLPSSSAFAMILSVTTLLSTFRSGFVKLDACHALRERFPLVTGCC